MGLKNPTRLIDPACQKRADYSIEANLKSRISRKTKFLLGAVDDFRTFNWAQMVKYPEMVWQQSKEFLLMGKLSLTTF